MPPKVKRIMTQPIVSLMAAAGLHLEAGSQAHETFGVAESYISFLAKQTKDSDLAF